MVFNAPWGVCASEFILVVQKNSKSHKGVTFQIKFRFHNNRTLNTDVSLNKNRPDLKAATKCVHLAKALLEISTLVLYLFCIGSDPGKQQNHHHPRQGPQPSDQAAASLPVQEHAQGYPRQHAQEPAGAAHPRERNLQNQKGLLPGHVPRHRHGYENKTTECLFEQLKQFRNLTVDDTHVSAVGIWRNVRVLEDVENKHWWKRAA